MARVALSITGGIGAYKAVEVARGLQKRGHDVVAVMTGGMLAFGVMVMLTAAEVATAPPLSVAFAVSEKVPVSAFVRLQSN